MNITPDSAADQVRFAEQSLRAFVARRMASTHGLAWEERIGKRIIGSLETIREKERSARPKAPDEAHLLGYAGFDNLIVVGQSHWDCCLKASGLWPTADLMKYDLNRLQAVRNPAMHGRTLFPHEYIEGEGSARRLRMDIEVLWRKEAAVNDKFWLYIEQAEDSLGNRSNSGIQASAINDLPSLLHVGDTIHFRVRAFDPSDRVLKYRLTTFAGEMTEWQDSPEFEWTAKPARQALDVRIQVMASDEPHAMADCDAFVDFRYEIRP